MSTEYLENRINYGTGERPGHLTINTNTITEGTDLYDIGTWRSSYVGASQYITVDAKFLHELADYIKENVPEPSTLEDAQYIKAKSSRSGLRYLFAKFDGVWYSETGTEHSVERILENYEITEVIV